jgi:tape measure domain-containing protein
VSEDKAKFGVELEDGVTPNAKKAQSSLERLRGTIEKFKSGFGRAVENLPDWGQKASSSLDRLKGKIKKFNKSGVGKAIEKLQDWGKQAVISGAVATVAVGAAVVGLTVKTVDFAAKSRIAFERVAHHGESGEQLFQRSIALAQDLGLDVQATAKQMIKFRALQFDQGQSEDLIKMGSDMRSLGASTDQVASIYAQFGQIMSKGRLQGEELTVLAENGISTKLVYENLAKSLHKTVPEIQKLMAGGKITAAQGLDAIGAALLQKTHTTQFGQAGKMAADQTMSGLLARMQSSSQGFFVKLADSVAPEVMKAFKEAIDQFSDFGSEIHLFDQLSEAMKLLSRIAERGAPLLRAFLEGFAGGVLQGVTTGFQDMSEALANMSKADVFEFGSQLGTVLGQLVIALGFVVDAIRFMTGPVGRVIFWFIAIGLVVAKVVGILVTLGPIFEAIGTAIVLAVSVVATVLSLPVAAAAAIVAAVVAAAVAIFAFRGEIAAFFVSVWETFTTAFANVYEWFFNIGASIGQGLVDGITNMAQSIYDTGAKIGSGIASSVKDVLRIASPSKVFFGIGENVAAGFNMGVESMGIPDINAPSLGFDGPTAPVVGKTPSASVAGNAAAASQGGFGGDRIFSPSITVPLSGSATKSDGEAFGAGIWEGLRSKWVSFNEDMAIEAGVNDLPAGA